MTAAIADNITDETVFIERLDPITANDPDSVDAEGVLITITLSGRREFAGTLFATISHAIEGALNGDV